MTDPSKIQCRRCRTWLEPKSVFYVRCDESMPVCGDSNWCDMRASVRRLVDMLEDAHGIVKDQSFCSCDDIKPRPCPMALEVKRQRALLDGEPIVFVMPPAEEGTS